MDAKPRKRRRESSVSLRGKRWSMSSQRLEQIVAELMKPVSHYGQSFDRDDSGLLEEYLTAAGLHALEALEAGQEPPPPNYAEMGMVIQSFANNYSKKVDHLSRLVSSFSQTLDSNNVLRSPDVEAERCEPARSTPGRRRRDTDPAEAGAGFATVEVSRCAAARREGPPTAPPPTLPRVYAELQPRPALHDRELRDYAGEVIGSLADFHVAWRLHDGYLVEELESGSVSHESSLRPLSLMELQEACARGAGPAPTGPPPTPPPPSPPSAPSAASTPLPATTATPSPERMPPPAALKRKRKSEVRIDDVLAGSIVFNIDASLMQRMTKLKEFSVSESWIRRVIRHRKEEILDARRLLSPPLLEFRGFDMAWTDIGGFKGWPAVESTAARAAARQTAALLGDLDSDDDGFFERSSSLGDSTRFSVDHSNQVSDGAEGAECAELESWQAGVARRAGRAAPLDLRALAGDVRRALPAPPAALPWAELAAATRHTQPVARVFLDLLMKTTKGETEIIDANPLSVGEFSIRVLTEEPLLSVEDEDWLAFTGVPPPPGDI